MTTRISTLALAVAAATLSSTAFASGFIINEQSASGVGTAYAGRAAVVEDASVVFYNPAGMSKLERAELSVGGTYINIDGKFSNGQRTNPAGIPVDVEGREHFNNGGNFIPDATIPFAYYAKPINDKLAVGFGLFVPYGTGSDYSKKALVGGFAGETSLQVINFQPSFSYKVLDNLAIGGGVNVGYAKGKLTKQLDLIPYAPTNQTTGALLDNEDYKGYENTFEVEGDDISYGFNLGLMWDITDATTLGLTYRSAMKIKLKGDAKFAKSEGVKTFSPDLLAAGLAGDDGLVHADLAAAILNNTFSGNPADYNGHVAKQKAEVPLDGPQTATLSLAHRFTDSFQLQGGVTWTDWSSFKYFDIKGREAGTISALGQLGNNYIGHIVEKWEDTYAFAIGGTYTVNEQWLLRAGFAYDQSPVKDAHRTARVPDNDRKWLTAGARYNVNQDLSFDLGLAYLFMSKASIDEYDYGLNDERMPGAGPDGLSPHNIKGDYEMDAFGVSLQMNYRM